MRKLTILNQKWYEQTLAKKAFKFKLFQKIETTSSTISIHQIVNKNQGIKLNYINDIELLKMVRKRKTILEYLENEYFNKASRNVEEYAQHKRRASNFLKWYKKLKGK